MKRKVEILNPEIVPIGEDFLKQVCKTSETVYITLTKYEQYWKDKLRQILMILHKKGIDWIPWSYDIDEVYEELLWDHQKFRNFIESIKKYNIIIKDTNNTLTREVLEWVAEILEKPENSENLTKTQLWLLSDEYMFWRCGFAGLSSLSSWSSKTINYTKFKTLINTTENLLEIKIIIKHYSQFLSENNNLLPRLLPDLAKTDSGKMAIYLIIKNCMYGIDTPDNMIKTFSPIIPDLAKNHLWWSIIDEIIKRAALPLKKILVWKEWNKLGFNKHDRKAEISNIREIFLPLLPDLVKTSGGCYAITTLIEKDILTADDKESLLPLLPDLAKTNKGRSAIAIMIEKDILTAEDKKILQPLLPDLAKIDKKDTYTHKMIYWMFSKEEINQAIKQNK